MFLSVNFSIDSSTPPIEVQVHDSDVQTTMRTLHTVGTGVEDDIDVPNIVQRTMKYMFKDPNLLLRALTLPTAQEDYNLNYKSLEYIGDGKPFPAISTISISTQIPQQRSIMRCRTGFSLIDSCTQRLRNMHHKSHPAHTATTYLQSYSSNCFHCVS